MNDEQNTSSKQRNRTKEHLKLALIELIKEKGYHTVTIKDIVSRSSYNRSTFYIHYRDKMDLAEDLLDSMLEGLEDSVGQPYIPGQKIYTANLLAPSFSIVSYIYKHRIFFELINFTDTLPELHTRFPQAILKIYKEQFVFRTINDIPVNMEYFKLYTAYGFYGLVQNWIKTGFKESQEVFIKEVIDLSKTHIHSFEYKGK
ncbi:TetR/AcrR family transcriptional regulator [Planomicrobium sp. CPCC 101079]|uniref:TetR/AcrR family transcriptional regulator n=1 Tax=Planomicrobium sp. CPCC 101079 TaxID=2599618 RepID=UPI0011B536AA|nr:TetR/AcrR family transcriptional regulator [Planomicrobium sp. CPCC 101079]TWT00575.1 TetR/AcrR family transcriptional regulator [Planomicrobium sp. CPCC 101079]